MPRGKKSIPRRILTPQEQYLLGERYERGLTLASIQDDPIQVDLVKAAHYYWQAARQNYIPAVFKYGVFCMQGKGNVPQNLEHAKALITRAVDAGLGPAIETLNSLGALFSQDKNNAQHVQYAKDCFEKVFNSGARRVAHNLAMWHIQHSSDPNKHEVAANYLEQALAAGYFPSYLLLGKIYENELIPEPTEGYIARAHALFSLALTHNVPYAAENFQRVDKILQNQRELLALGVDWDGAASQPVRFSESSGEKSPTENGASCYKP